MEPLDIDRATEGLALGGVCFPWHTVDPDYATMFSHGGAVRGVCGVAIAWPGFAQAWAVFDESYAAGKGRQVIRFGRQWVTTVCQQHNLRQMRHMAGTLKAIKMAELMGFELEGVWREAGPSGEDIFIMAYHRRN